MNSVKTSKMGLWMSVVAMTLSASAAVATDETQTAQALIGDFTPDRPDVGTIGFPPPPAGGGSFTPPVDVNPESPDDDAPVRILTSDMILAEAEDELWWSRQRQYTKMRQIYLEIEMAVTASNVPASKQTISAARAQFKSIARAGQAERKAILNDQSRRLRSWAEVMVPSGSAKDLLKELSNRYADNQLMAKNTDRWMHERVRALGVAK